MTAVTGLVDAVSVLVLGRVFVANMTGNVVFTGFALGGAPGFTLSASLFALAGFLAGAALGGLLIDRLARDRAQLLGAGASIETLLVLAACLMAAAVSAPFDSAVRDAIAALLALAMGIQNAVARKLAVPDMTTTVLTMTLTGIGADLHSRSYRPVLLRRLSAVVTMLGGAVLGTVLVLHTSATVPLAVAAGILALATAGSALATRRPAPWREGPR
ncbi:MAG: YoaK family protein [Jatrophihabitantaceae bacterium]